MPVRVNGVQAPPGPAPGVVGGEGGLVGATAGRRVEAAARNAAGQPRQRHGGVGVSVGQVGECGVAKWHSHVHDQRHRRHYTATPFTYGHDASRSFDEPMF